jgi:hypothetical protein
MIVKTTTGTQQYFRRAKGNCTKSNSHTNGMHPEHIGIETGDSLVTLPPSPGHTLLLGEAKNLGEFTEPSRDFIDAVLQHNYLPPPDPIVCDAVEPKVEPCETEIIVPDEQSAGEGKAVANPLDKFSLRGMSQEIAKQSDTRSSLEVGFDRFMIHVELV